MNGRLIAIAAVALIAGSSTSTGQAPPLQRLMREKLEHSQAILAAVVTSDWQALDAHSRELERIANDPAWTVLRTPEYARYSANFLRATQDLRDAATRLDQETAPVAFVSLTLSCVQCHRYVARARVAD